MAHLPKTHFVATSVLVLMLALQTAAAQSGKAAQKATLTNRVEVARAGNPKPLVMSFQESWAPPDIDQVVPPVNPDVPCPLNEVLSGVSARVKELTENLQQFSAIERIDHVEVRKNGSPHAAQSATFTYVAQIHEASPGPLQFDEYRNGTESQMQSFPAKVATTGTAAHALIFHPEIIDDYKVTCEGLGNVRAQPLAVAFRAAAGPARPLPPVPHPPGVVQCGTERTRLDRG